MTLEASRAKRSRAHRARAAAKGTLIASQAPLREGPVRDEGEDREAFERWEA